jgi:sulfite oxidase
MALRLNRRLFLAGGAGTVASAGLIRSGAPAWAQDGALPEYVSFKNADDLIIHTPSTIETKRGAIGVNLITPETQLFVRNNISPPDASIVEDRDAWEVSITGVGEPRTVTVGELKRLGVTTVAAVLQCSGNGRKFFEHAPSGTPWDTGAAGCVMWTGVPLRAVVEALGGVAGSPSYVTGTGGEVIPAELNANDVIVERSVPIDVLDNIILAWDINGFPISLAHGGPLRMVVPGFTGVNSVKYIKSIALTEQQTEARIQSGRYRLQPVGEKATPEFDSVWQMNVKSWITGPLESTPSGKTNIIGVAMGGMNPASKIEVSIDGGDNWQEAQFIGPDLGRFAWRTFVLNTELDAGTYRLASRATDSEGNVQPKELEMINNDGYNHNGWMAHGVDLTVS